MPIISRLVKGVGSGIGLASEAIADHKEKKAAEKGRATSPNPQSTSRSTSPYPPEKSANISDNDSDDSEDSLNNDNAEWALDDAASQLEPPPYSESEDLQNLPPMPIEMGEYAKSFVRTHNIEVNYAARPLPLPVILPQRRPKDKTRGFVRAYAPVLDECSGIDQQTFIDFLETFDRASQASPVFNVINLACFAAGMVPNPIAMGVTIAVQIASKTAEEIQRRNRTNTFLDQINESLFKPKGLYAIIMTFKPDDPHDPVIGVDINATTAALTKSLSVPESQVSQKMKSLRLSSGTTKGEIALPESAPLIYPALDAALTTSTSHNSIDQLPEKKKHALLSTPAYMSSYLDRRAQATYAGMHPESKLAVPPPDKKFASRFSDPNHPANSGTILGLLTGGNFDPKARKRGRKAQRRAARHGDVLSQNDIRNAEMGRAPPRKKGIIRRVLQRNVLYLMIVNLPSESEMAEMRQELERIKQQKKAEGGGW